MTKKAQVFGALRVLALAEEGTWGDKPNVYMGRLNRAMELATTLKNLEGTNFESMAYLLKCAEEFLTE